MDWLTLCCVNRKDMRYSETTAYALGLPRESQVMGGMWVGDLSTVVLHGHEHWVHGCAFVDDDSEVLTWSQDGTLRLWDADSGAPVRVFEGHEGTVRCAQFSPNHERFVSASYDKSCMIWDIKNQVPQGSLEAPANGFALCCAWSQAGVIASGHENGKVMLWDVETEASTHVFQDHKAWVWSCAFASPKLLVTGSYDKDCRLWDVKSKHCIGVLEGHRDFVFATKVSFDGHWLATCSADNTWRVWDLRQRKTVVKKTAHEDWVWDVALLPSSARLASVSRDKSMKVWDVNTGALVCEEESAHDGAVRSCCFSTTGAVLATGGTDEKAKLWTSAKGEQDRPQAA